MIPAQLDRKRKHGFSHPWNRGFPSNKFLCEAAGEQQFKYCNRCGEPIKGGGTDKLCGLCADDERNGR